MFGDYLFLMTIFRLKGCMNLMMGYVSLTTAAMKMSKRQVYIDHNNGC